MKSTESRILMTVWAEYPDLNFGEIRQIIGEASNLIYDRARHLRYTRLTRAEHCANVSSNEEENSQS